MVRIILDTFEDIRGLFQGNGEQIHLIAVEELWQETWTTTPEEWPPVRSALRAFFLWRVFATRVFIPFVRFPISRVVLRILPRRLCAVKFFVPRNGTMAAEPVCPIPLYAGNLTG